MIFLSLIMIDLLYQYWGSALFAFGFSFLSVLFVLRFFPRFGLMDRPHLYGHDRSPIPYYGGLSVFVTFIVSVLLFVPLSLPLVGFLISSFLIVLTGFFDDYLNLSPVFRLFVQFISGLILFVCGVGILSVNLPFFGVLSFDLWIVSGVSVLSMFFTIFWVMALVNTMNFVDGVSGLSSGVTFISSLTIFFLSINPDLNQDLASQEAVATIALILAFVSLAFLIFDFPKAKLLLGDTGSTFFGFALATLAIFSGGKVATAFIVLGLPILDMLWVVFRRVLSGKKFWKGDRMHLHHRLMDAGLSEKSVVSLYLFITFLLGLGSVLLVNTLQKFFMIIALFVFMLLLALSLLFLKAKKV